MCIFSRPSGLLLLLLFLPSLILQIGTLPFCGVWAPFQLRRSPGASPSAGANYVVDGCRSAADRGYKLIHFRILIKSISASEWQTTPGRFFNPPCKRSASPETRKAMPYRNVVLRADEPFRPCPSVTNYLENSCFGFFLFYKRFMKKDVETSVVYSVYVITEAIFQHGSSSSLVSQIFRAGELPMCGTVRNYFENSCFEFFPFSKRFIKKDAKTSVVCSVVPIVIKIRNNQLLVKFFKIFQNSAFWIDFIWDVIRKLWSAPKKNLLWSFGKKAIEGKSNCIAVPKLVSQ